VFEPVELFARSFRCHVEGGNFISRVKLSNGTSVLWNLEAARADLCLYRFTPRCSKRAAATSHFCLRSLSRRSC
jgi:hypothetical protein